MEIELRIGDWLCLLAERFNACEGEGGGIAGLGGNKPPSAPFEEVSVYIDEKCSRFARILGLWAGNRA